MAQTNYASHPRLHHGNSQSKTAKPGYLIGIQGCCHCEFRDHIAGDCPRSRNHSRVSSQKLDYFNTKKENNTYHVVLASSFASKTKAKKDQDETIFLSLMTGEGEISQEVTE